MAFITINADFKLLIKTLERIADALDRAIPPIEEPSREQVEIADINQSPWPYNYWEQEDEPRPNN